MQRRTDECDQENGVDDEEDRRANEPCDTLTLWNELQEDSVRNDRYCENKGQIHRTNGKKFGAKVAAERGWSIGQSRAIKFTSTLIAGAATDNGFSPKPLRMWGVKLSG